LPGADFPGFPYAVGVDDYQLIQASRSAAFLQDINGTIPAIMRFDQGNIDEALRIAVTG
jgi:hypothetical protein